MAKLILTSLTCNAQEDWTGDDDIQILADQKPVWRGDMNPGPAKSLGDIEVDFEDSVEVQLVEKDLEGDDVLGTVTVDKSKAGTPRVGRYQQDGADYSLAYRVNTADDGDEGAEDDEWWQEQPEAGTCGAGGEDAKQDDAKAVNADAGPKGNCDPNDPTELCPLGTLIVEVTDKDKKTGIPLVEVVLTPPGMTAPTRDDGTFTHQLNPGTYKVRVSKEGYLPKPAEKTAKIESGKPTRVKFALKRNKPGVAIQTVAVVCPGHKHLVKAVGNPAGGTFKWKIDSGDARLIDNAGVASTTGDQLFLQAIKPQRITLSVTYTTAGGTAKATKKLKVHTISYKVTNYWVKRGVTQADETAGGLRLGPGGKATFAMDPKVKISVAGSCPRKNACAGNHRVGWLQTVRKSDRNTKYPKTRIEVTVGLPIRDAAPPYSLPPFYSGNGVNTFTGNKNSQTAHHEDSPGSSRYPWLDARVAIPPIVNKNMESLTLKNTFTAWLVVQNIEWANDVSPEKSFTYLKHISWRCGMTTGVNHTKAVGKRAKKRREKAKYWGSGKGKGGFDPKLDAPIANTSAVSNTVALP